jgi:hypothetical protein
MVRYKSKDKPLFCAFLDVSKAYDSVWRDAMMAKLWKKGIRGNLWKLIYKMNANVRRRVKLNEK